MLIVTCFTGAVLVYEKELQQLFHHSRYFNNGGTSQLPADSLLSIVKTELNTNPVSIKTYNDPERNIEITIPLRGESTKKIPSKRPPREVVFINPYSGQIQEIYNHRESFFFFMMDLHRWMLSGDTGKMIVGICTIVFLFILITGIILWWPKNKAILKQRIKMKWNAGFKRFNHDSHVVLGFYSSIFLFILAFTGLAWSFKWFNDGIYTITGTKQEQIAPLKSTPQNSLNGSVEATLQETKQLVNSSYYNLSLPSKSEDAYKVTVLPKDASMDVATDVYFFDQYTGAYIGVQKFEDKNTGQKVRSAFKPIHTATIFGQPSKLIGFLACVLGTFFPISGIIMWWNRTRKKKRK